jgi:hypothetical protein
MHQSWKETALHRMAGNAAVQGVQEALLAAAMDNESMTEEAVLKLRMLPGQHALRGTIPSDSKG